MGIINQDRLVEIVEHGSEQEKATMARHLHSASNTYRDFGESRWTGDLATTFNRLFPRTTTPVTFNRESALEVYGQIKEMAKRRGWFGGKAMRPWIIDRQLLDNLDRTQPWWGFEFECGFASEQQRSDVIEYVWDTWDGVTFDSEGEEYASEITFVPSELSTYEDGTAPALQFMQYINDNKLGHNTGRSGVGTHLNLSLPEFSQYEVISRVSSGLNNTLGVMPQNNTQGENLRLKLFGRSSLYGGFYPQERYIEGKLFRTTYNIDKFRTYLNTSRVITRCAQVLSALPAMPGVVVYVNNFAEMCEDESVEPILRVGYGSFSSVNGGYSEAIIANGSSPYVAPLAQAA